jgi:hypothetical protein
MSFRATVLCANKAKRYAADLNVAGIDTADTPLRQLDKWESKRTTRKIRPRTRHRSRADFPTSDASEGRPVSENAAVSVWGTAGHQAKARPGVVDD